MIGETIFIATARLDAEGNASVKVTATTPYGERTASVSIDVTDEKIVAAVEKALQSAAKAVHSDLRQQSVAAAAECLVVATKNKEAV